MTERAFAEERCAALDRIHLRGGPGGIECALAHAAKQVFATRFAGILEQASHRIEHIEQSFLTDLSFAQAGEGSDARSQCAR